MIFFQKQCIYIKDDCVRGGRGCKEYLMCPFGVCWGPLVPSGILGFGVGRWDYVGSC